MSTQLRNQETSVKAAPSPAQNQFQARPFVEEAEAESRSIDAQHSIAGNTTAPPETPIQPKPNSPASHYFSRVTLHANPVQPKLTIGQPNDQYEQEADQVADQVMKMAAPPDHPSIQRQADESWMQPMRITPLVQRQIEGEELQMQSIGVATPRLQRQAEEEPDALQLKPLMGFVQRQEEDDIGAESPLLQRFAAQAPTQQPDTQTSALENQLSRRQGGGSPLPEDVRAFMEPRFGYDFSHVRVHTDGEAVQMNRDVSAQAFTHRNDIYFNAGKFNANSDEGKTLLAHELTHVVQQTGGKTLQRRSLSHLPANKETVQTKISTSPHTVLQRKEAPKSPEEDPGFQKVHDRIKGTASKEKSHPPAKAKANEAQAAATPPAGEVDSKAKDRQVQEMAQQQPGQFNAAAFKAALMQKIADAAPKNLKEADEFKHNNKLDSVKGDVSSKVKDEKKQAAGPVEQKTKEAPDSSGITPKPVTPLKPEQADAPPANLGAAQAAPKPKDPSEVSMQQGSQELDQQMQEAKVTNEQLANSGESTFVSALDAKKESQAHANTAPAQYRQEEQGVLGQAQAEAQTTAEAKTKAMHGDRKGLLAQVVASQTQTKGVDEQERAKVTNHIQGIYNATKQKVENRLSKLDEDVAKEFDQGAEAAKTEAVNYIDSHMTRYKLDRYLLQPGGALLWIKDQLMELPSEVNVFYQEGRKLYIDRMGKTIDKVANLVSTQLNEAKADINAGKKEIQTYVAGLDPALKQVGQQAANSIQDQFKELEQSVDSKQNELIDSLAQKYNEKLQEMDACIDEIKAANRGLVNKAKDAIDGVIKTILELKNMLMGVLSKAAGAIEKIIQDPIGFLGNLVAGIKKGFQNFVGNIWTHLKKGLIGWLVGALAGGGIQLPESFDLKGIFSLVMQVLGLAYEVIRPKLVAILGEKVVAALEKSFEIIKILVTEGVAGLWNFVKDKVGDLKTMVMDGIQNFVIDSVIKQGVMWVLSLLNPASAFVKACKMIYDVIMFFIERGSQIIELVNAVTDSVAAIANGAIDAAAGLVENALAKALPVVISFMASLLGLSGISEKIQEIVKKVRAPIDKAIGWLIGKAVAFAKKIGKKLGFGKKKDGKPDERTDAQKQSDLAKAMHEVSPIIEDPKLSHEKKVSRLERIKTKYQMSRLELVTEARKGAVETFHVEAEINPKARTPSMRDVVIPKGMVKLPTQTIGVPLSARPKRGAENVLDLPGKVGQQGKHRSHIFGPIIGHDRPEGMSYAPESVNLKYMEHGIEAFMKELREIVPSEITLRLSPAVRRKRTAVLEEVNYVVFAQRGEDKETICDITIEIDYTRSETDPKVLLSAELVGQLFQ